jgi:UDP-3-O-[3-hydroxymyristoyl] glucosamine N-acyltransferase
MKLEKLAELTGGVVESGSGLTEIKGAAGLDIAGSDEITFLANPKYTGRVNETSAAAIFIGKNAKIERTDIAVIRTDDAYVAYTLALRAFYPDPGITIGIHKTASIDDSATIAKEVEIAANVVIGKDCVVGSGVRIMPNVTVYDRVRIGKNTVLHSGVSIREDCEIGANVIIHNNSTIGSDGFGFARTAEKTWLKIPQVGRVVIEDDVEIGANTAIDCASVGESRIKRGAKIDNLVQIGHSCTVGEDSLICAQTGLAGSSVIGDRVILAGQVGIAGHLTIGDDVTVTAKSATSHDVEDGQIVSGIPAFENRDWLRSTAAFRRLGTMSRMLRKLEKEIEKVKGEINDYKQ